jgi:hypothetical protein
MGLISYTNGTKLSREFLEDLELFPEPMKQYQWAITEDIQDSQPHLEWGWAGFVPLVIYRGLTEKETIVYAI